MTKLKHVLATTILAIVLFPTPFLAAQGTREYTMSDTAGDSSGLPLTRVILYVSGVGYFQREGAVSGNQEVALTFKTAEVNDLLKSLTVRDLDGGKITGVTYGSQDPVEKRLKSFAVNLSGNPGLSSILTQLRGENVSLAVPDPVEGLVVGVEGVTDKDGVQILSLNILTSGGLRAFLLKDIKNIKFTNPRVDSEFRKALGVIAESHDVDKKTVRIGFTGNGNRRVSMGYLTEAPAWKTAYRLVLDDTGDHFLQGWAIVENATDEDWKDVSLSLVSGRPISFVMDLSTPRYINRPVVRQSTAAGPAPQTYDDSLLSKKEKSGAPMPPAAAPSVSRALDEMGYAGSGAGAYPAEESLYAEVTPGSISAGVSSYGSLESAGSFVRYKINVPVNLPRRESAMFPLVDGTVGGKKISVYDPSVDPKRPLLGVELSNTTTYSLLAGPITVFEAGAYAGDALIEDLLPGGERLITYAVDMETEVAPMAGPSSETIISMILAKGIFYLYKSASREQKYTIKNSSEKVKEVIIVKPLDSSWKLTAPKEAPETTRNTYRFRVSVKAGGTETLTVTEERQLSQSFGLVSLSDSQLVYYSSEKAAKPELKKAFATIVEKRSAIKAVAADRQDAERKMKQFKDEQSRIRSNMNSISSSSDLYKKYMGMLEEQENAIAQLLESIDGYYVKEKDLTKELDDYMLALDLR